MKKLVFFLACCFFITPMELCGTGPNQPYYNQVLDLVKKGDLLALQNKLQNAKFPYDLNSDTYTPNIITQAIEFKKPNAVPVVLQAIFDKKLWHGDDTFIVLTRDQDKPHLDALRKDQNKIDGKVYVLLVEAIAKKDLNQFKKVLSQAALRDLEPEHGLSLADYMKVNVFINTDVDPHKQMHDALAQKLQNLSANKKPRTLDGRVAVEKLGQALKRIKLR